MLDTDDDVHLVEGEVRVTGLYVVASGRMFLIRRMRVAPELDIEAEIRNVQQAADAEAEGIEYHYGVDFHELGAEDRMKIKSLVYQTIIEQPRRII